MKCIFIIYKFSIFGQYSCTLEAGPNKTKKVKTQDLFFFLTEPLIYDEMGYMSALISKGMPRSRSHTQDYGKSQSQQKKRDCVVCPVY